MSLSGTGSQGIFVTVTPGRYLAIFTCTGELGSIAIWAAKDGSYKIVRTLPADSGKNINEIELPEAGPNIVMISCDGAWTFEAVPIR